MDDKHLFAVSQTEAYTSADGGTTWTRSTSGLPTNLRGKYWGPARIHDIAIDAKNPSRVLLAREDGVFLSSDRGLSWSVRLADLDCEPIRIALVDAWDTRWLITLSINQDMLHQYPYWAAVRRFPLLRSRRRGPVGRSEME